MNYNDFNDKVNKMRKQLSWYSLIEEVDGKHVELEGYHTWLQIYRIDGVDYSNYCDRSVKQFNDDLFIPFN